MRALIQPFIKNAVRAFAGESDGGVLYNAVTFDGTNDYLTATESPFADGGYFTAVFKFRLNALGSAQRLLNSQLITTGLFNIIKTATETITIRFMQSSSLAGIGTTTIATGLNSLTTDYTVHIAGSKDGAGALKCWVNGVSTYSGTWVTPGPGDIDFSTFDYGNGLMATSTGVSKVNANVSLAWIVTGNTAASYIINPLKFYNLGDVNLGLDGSLPGIAPQVFYGGSQTAAQWNAGVGSNQGTGVDYTMILAGSPLGVEDWPIHSSAQALVDETGVSITDEQGTVITSE